MRATNIERNAVGRRINPIDLAVNYSTFVEANLVIQRDNSGQSDCYGNLCCSPYYTYLHVSENKLARKSKLLNSVIG